MGRPATFPLHKFRSFLWVSLEPAIRATVVVLLLVGALGTSPATAQEFNDSGQSLGDGHTEAVATGDLDGDGHPDLVIGNGSNFDIDAPNTVWLNDGTGTFTDTGQSLGTTHTQDVALADVDGDGDLDLIAANGMPDGEIGGATNKVWLNDGTGTFSDSGQGFGPYDTGGIAVADLDDDGDLDFVAAREGSSEANAVWLNDGSGTFESDQFLGDNSTNDVALADVDGDDDPDLLAGNNSGIGGSRNVLWLNDGTGTFTESDQTFSLTNTYDVAFADLDGDGAPDIVDGVRADASGNEVWMNDGDGTFTNTQNFGGNAYTVVIAVGDLDDDGDPDLVEGKSTFGAGGRPNRVWTNDNGTFTNTGQTLGNGETFGLSVADTDGDLDNDFVAGNGGGSSDGAPSKVWLNTGEGENQPPTAMADSFSTQEDNTLTVSVPGVLGNDSDPDGDSLTAVLVEDVSNGSLTLEEDGAFEYDPATNFNGTDSFTYEATDSTGAADTAEVALTVEPVNDPPTVTTNTGLAVDEGAGAPITTDDLSASDPDDGPPALTFTVTSGPSQGTLRVGGEPASSFTQQDLLDGEVAYDHTADGAQDDSFTFDLKDDDGAGPTGRTFQITVNAVNDPPTAVADSFSTPEDSTLTVEAPGVLENDSDPDGDPLDASLVSDVSNGTLTLDADGSFTYIPASGFTGTDSFQYEAVDDNSAADTAQVTLTVMSTNAPPTVALPLPDDTLQTPGPSLQLTGLTTTVFDDPDGDSLAVSATSDAPGVVEAVGDSPQVVLQPNSVGTAEVTVTASDGMAEASSAFTVTVDPLQGEEPVAQATALVDTAGSGQAFDFGETGNKIVPAVSGGSGSIDVQRFDSAPDGTDGIVETNVSQYRVVITAGGTLTFGDTTEVRFPVQDFSGIDDPAAVTVYSRPTPGGGTFSALGTSVDEQGTPGDPSDDEIVAETGSFSEFVLASDSAPLPVELAEFAARLDGSTARLRWRTASETNNARFEVLRRGPGAEKYDQVGAVDSKAEGGTTTEPKSYRFAATGLRPGTHRFRLRQVDLDGRTTRTEAVTVAVEAERALTLRLEGPNPVRQSTQLAFTVKQSGKATVALFNVLGQRVQTLRAEEAQAGERYRTEVSAGTLTSGTYFVRLRAPSGIRARKLVVVR